MAWILDHRDSYSPAETRLDAGIHVAGLVLVGFGVPLLLVIAVMVALQGGEMQLLWTTAIYGLALAAMIGASALFNLLREARLSWLYQRLDHSAIFLKIAGSYTPLTLIPGQGGGFVALLWLTACAGVALKLYSPVRFRGLGIALYLGMGWAGVAILPQLWGNLPLSSLALILAAGAVYTLGVIFYLATRLRYHYAIWHVCVLLASLMIYAAVLALLVARWGELAEI
ncbi:hemolysin III family protein [Roseibaca sp. V10]|uniref:Hemolysin III family protein n=1 Tax=Roseinatronobacter domitianus TaxID=2940293 RepID=A0ABT0LYU6_9RHOB|nr:hemolysin III family protein [Roseibaca domitiana]MCL1627229.1 hemolysin III family protein [Roseibaca domitiana]